MMNNTGLNKKYQFENFVEKDGNVLAKKEAVEVVKNLGLKYSPFYIYGESGSGKTTLLNSIISFLDMKKFIVTGDFFLFENIEMYKVSEKERKELCYKNISMISLWKDRETTSWNLLISF